VPDSDSTGLFFDDDIWTSVSSKWTDLSVVAFRSILWASLRIQGTVAGQWPELLSSVPTRVLDLSDPEDLHTAERWYDEDSENKEGFPEGWGLIDTLVETLYKNHGGEDPDDVDSNEVDSDEVNYAYLEKHPIVVLLPSEADKARLEAEMWKGGVRRGRSSSRESSSRSGEVGS
jgi:hypothetical protein